MDECRMTWDSDALFVVPIWKTRVNNFIVKKKSIEKMDNVSAFTAKTIDHMQKIYPSSNLTYQKKANVRYYWRG